MQVNCPHCGVTVTVGPQQASHTVACPECDGQFQVPTAVPPAAPVRKSSGIGPTLIIIAACGLMGMVVVGGCMAAMLLPAIQAAREAARRSACVNNLKQLGVALHNHHDAQNEFPAASGADNQGGPPASWRVRLLPYVEQKMLYDQYDFDEEWDGPNNSLLCDIEMMAFRCPSASSGDGRFTSYVAVVGEEATFRAQEGLRFRDMVDGSSNTIGLVEMADSGIHWSEPRDLSLEEASQGVNNLSGAGPAISSEHTAVANVLFMDGGVRGIHTDIEPGILRALLTPTGGEDVGGFFYEN